MNSRSNRAGLPAWLRTPAASLVGAAVAALLVTSALALQAQAEVKYLIDRQVWGGYQEYLKTIGTTKAGAFAITEDGRDYYYTWCPGLHCIGATTYGHKAQSRCEAQYGRDCLVFAVRGDIRVQYQIRE